MLVAAAIAVALFATTTMTGTAAHADDTSSSSDGPTWADVDAAKNDIAATQTLIDQITATLSADQQTANTTGDAAVAATAAATAAQKNADAAAAKLDDLNAQLSSAKAEYSSITQAAGEVVVAAARNSGGVSTDVQALVSGDPDALLAALTMSERVSSIAGSLVDRARRAEANIETLTASAKSQSDALSGLSAEADQAAEQAKSENAAANQAVATEAANQQTLNAKLAALQNTTATEIAQIQQREAAEAAYKAQQAEAAAAAAATSTTSSDSGGSSTDASSSTTNTSSSVDNSPSGAKAYANSQLASYGWGSSQYTCLVNLWNRESGWSYTATNTSSGAYGIPQSLPGSKMASAGSDWRTNSQTQINWGLGYIQAVYGSPCSAWSHEVNIGWY